MSIREIVSALVEKYDTRNPFEIAACRSIKIIRSELKSILGYYTKYHRVQSIILSTGLPEHLENFVCAHELGHAICHPDINVQWLCEGTFYAKGKFERQANTFAVELLLPDNLLREHPEQTVYQIARSVGVPEEFVDLKDP
ncbi:ImmA/IrrE family metallo-endopeptidase [Selenomonas noxia]|jgi:Zn-dependent peptidase ImmA (M78 family)|uniref:ImmA/IrrE family metallo-endopeptidase n=1 Tax=Selenomonas noxia TaxID=135083 RepID=UPI00204BE938|nr:ImmA/IrrE family metallo-endopeptidase [Selenomonas noxia]DAQ29363.1 MAG TPA: IrrE protein [Caudoviricetes sp.]